MIDQILAEQRTARDHIAIHGADYLSALWLQDLVKEELLVSGLLREKTQEVSDNG